MEEKKLSLKLYSEQICGEFIANDRILVPCIFTHDFLSEKCFLRSCHYPNKEKLNTTQ